MDMFDQLETVNLITVPKRNSDHPEPTNAEYAAWMRWKGAGDLVEMMGFSDKPVMCGARKSGRYCPQLAGHSGNHKYVEDTVAV